MYFKLFTNCKIVKGNVKSIIIDTQRNFYHDIPNSLYTIIKDLECKSINEVKNEIEDASISIFDSYLEFLVENDFGFITDKANQFLYVEQNKINKPSNNFIIEFSSKISKNIIYQLKDLNIDALHINFYEEIDINELNDILNQIINITSISFVSILSLYNKELNENTWLNLGVNYPILGQIFISSSPIEKTINSESLILIYSKENISFKNCGIVTPKYFSFNTYMYNESFCFNSCLGGKISIDINGNIKNCPSMPQSFGNIKDTSLEEALNHKEFKKYWNLTKDSVEVCKDCEFRYICTDCRAYTEQTHTNDQGLDISKPLKCGYNPYTGEWQEWSTNPLKQKAMKYYRFDK
ncbi:SPASM domain peptide maturase, grasp-with-spasm system [Chryseobacterium sp. RU37D]|uniref:grasp-with-spasm system SPASM domain peptide maturase n=1 Tax=Chryseobacterium sp. RU37D TaxID=1907397 RepID=UPI000955E4AC|nr:grasp-with-spasm system SPASM domain peptide maturase [Chryseobacterium sp. RU37D]SIQ27147.1 SPASM domain peptide maturase, grasp-with-spasm system [Chryseobacterium sp. RU37D]